MLFLAPRGKIAVQASDVLDILESSLAVDHFVIREQSMLLESGEQPGENGMHRMRNRLCHY